MGGKGSFCLNRAADCLTPALSAWAPLFFKVKTTHWLSLSFSSLTEGSNWRTCRTTQPSRPCPFCLATHSSDWTAIDRAARPAVWGLRACIIAHGCYATKWTACLHYHTFLPWFERFSHCRESCGGKWMKLSFFWQNMITSSNFV